MDIILIFLLRSYLATFFSPCEIAGVDQELQVMAAVSVPSQLIGIRIGILPESDELFPQIPGWIITSLFLPDVMGDILISHFLHIVTGNQPARFVEIKILAVPGRFDKLGLYVL